MLGAWDLPLFLTHMRREAVISGPCFLILPTPPPCTMRVPVCDTPWLRCMQTALVVAIPAIVAALEAHGGGSTCKLRAVVLLHRMSTAEDDAVRQAALARLPPQCVSRAPGGQLVPSLAPASPFHDSHRLHLH